MDVLMGSDGSLWRVSDKLPFAAVTANLGPQTICSLHRDFLNLVFGWCLIFILGEYDHTKGGHIILWEPKLVVEVRPGDLVYLPSGCVTHGNVPLKDSGERRYSVTWYTAGGLFAWVAAGYQTLKDWKINDPDAARANLAEGRKRWVDGWNYFETMSSIESRAPAAGVV